MPAKVEPEGRASECGKRGQDAVDEILSVAYRKDFGCCEANQRCRNEGQQGDES